MKFQSKQRIQGTVEEVERALFDERYPDFLVEHHGVLLEAKLVEQKNEGDTLKRQVRYRPRPVIKSIGPKTVPPEWFAFIETSTYDRRKKELKFSNAPTSQTIRNLLVNTGVLRLKDVGGGSTERTLEGEISLKLPFLMKPLALIGEKIIQSEGLKILDAEVAVLNRFIAERIRSS
jgi:hypothetical protein